MLDKVELKEFNKWADIFLKKRMSLKTSNSEEDMADNRKVFEQIDFILELQTPLVAVTPVLISTGLLRYTFAIRHCLSNWDSYRDEVYKQFSIKFKQKKVQSLLRGLL